jgi:pimeloyl-ACP methyl ester carboxylesterase
MPNNNILTPKEAAYIATNSYFTLKDWINDLPVAGVETRPNIKNRVIGNASVGTGNHDKTSLKHFKNRDISRARLGNVHSATTGFGTSSGFGYTLTYNVAGQKHVVIATRGTRPEMPSVPDIITDFRASSTGFGSFGPVHKGFKRTFDSIQTSLNRDTQLIASADVVHCVGHSLGGAVATLIAADIANSRKNVKLYTFGSPRVGCLNTYAAIEQAIGPQNIYRVAHDLDPISLIAPYPYIHVQPRPSDPNNMTLPSPLGSLLSTDNHDMRQYIKSVQDRDWDGVRLYSNNVDHDNALLSRWLLHDTNDPGWVTYASAKTLSILFKLFTHLLKSISSVIILGLTAVDLLAEILLKGLNRLKILGDKIFQLLKYAAVWAGIKAVESADFTADIIKLILAKMLSTLKELSLNAIVFATRNITPLTINMGSTWMLAAAGVL